MKQINELEFRIERAQFYYHCLTTGELAQRWQWCVYVGLWETSGWISTDKDKKEYDRPSQYDLLKLVIPGQRGYK